MIATKFFAATPLSLLRLHGTMNGLILFLLLICLVEAFKHRKLRAAMKALFSLPLFPFRRLFGPRIDHRFELVSRHAFFTQAERKFFDALDEVAKKGKLRVFSKVRLADIVVEAPGAKSQFQRYGNMHVDYLLVKEDGFLIVAGIELDGDSHLEKRQRYNDEKKDQIFKSARIPMLRFKNDGDNSPGKIRKELEKVLKKHF